MRVTYTPQIQRILFSTRRRIAYRLVAAASTALACAIWLYQLH
jgi:hypothetical protein